MMRWMAVMAALIAASPAWAGPGRAVVGLDVERGSSLQLDGSDVTTAAGVRVGYGLDLKLLEIVPEGRLMLVGTGPEREPSWGTAELGGRVMIGKILEPGVYARAVAPLGQGGPGPGVHAGGLLAFTAIPLLDLGVHGGVLLTGEAPTVLAGGHVTLNF